MMNAQPNGRSGPPLAELSTAELISRATSQVSGLVHDELQLARYEMATKAKRVGLGAGLLGGAGVFAFWGFGALLTTIVLAIGLVIPYWAAALAVTGGIFLLTGLLALTGVLLVRRAQPAMPSEAIDEVMTDIATVRERAHR